MKRGWYKNKTSNEVLFCEGRGHCDKAVVVRNRDGSRTWMWKSNLAELYEPIKASGFPSLKPKEFKPRYAVYHLWSDGEAFVLEFEPGKFKVVMKDGREILRDEGTCKYFAKFFENGSWKLIPEAEALARLDKPKPPVPAAEQFDPRRNYYGLDVEYHATIGGEMFYVTRPGGSALRHRGAVHASVVRNLWDLGMVVDVRPRNTESIVGQASAVLDVPKDVKPKKKVLVEWAVASGSLGCHYTELWPEGVSPAAGQKRFKTGRTVEVPE